MLTSFGIPVVLPWTRRWLPRLRERFGFVGLGEAGIRGLGLCRRHVEQAALSGDVVGAHAAGEQTVVTDPVEALRQDVDQESADELARCALRPPFDCFQLLDHGIPAFGVTLWKSICQNRRD